MLALPRNVFVLVLSLVLLVKEGRSLQCYECMSVMGMGHADCDSPNPSANYIRECADDEKYCSTSTSEMMGANMLLKNCSAIADNTPYECEETIMGKNCHGVVSCSTDLCNGNHGNSIFTISKEVAIITCVLALFLIK